MLLKIQEIPQVKLRDKVDDMHVPMKTAEIPQLRSREKAVHMPVVMQGKGQTVLRGQKTMKTPHIEF